MKVKSVHDDDAINGILYIVLYAHETYYEIYLEYVAIKTNIRNGIQNIRGFARLFHIPSHKKKTDEESKKSVFQFTKRTAEQFKA